MKRKLSFILVIVLIAGLALSGCGKTTTPTTPTTPEPTVEFIKIGSVMPVTGAIAT